MSSTVLDRFRLDDKVAVVTGASSGLGVAFAKALAEAGSDLVLAARRAERLEQTRQLVEDRGRRALAVSADVSRPEDAQAVVDAAIDQLGRVDILVNNAGKGTAVPSTRETQISSARSSTSTSTAATGWRRPAARSCSPAV
jgi:NAD(P)-dependent dehydrogenase (short-subunit alcohol dehydrogenase family)